MTMRFFMVGSWTEGMVHFEKLAPFVMSSESASILASVYRLQAGFPVLVNTKKSLVRGQLVEIQADSAILSLLDTFHGVHPSDATKSVYNRTTAEILKDGGLSEMAQVYFYNEKKLKAKDVLIEDSQWRKSIQQNPPLSATLSDKQREYILKLGAAKGRDIVPIQDLSLYRELMKLELIVDKGRRLALSALGKDVYAHLV